MGADLSVAKLRRATHLRTRLSHMLLIITLPFAGVNIVLFLFMILRGCYKVFFGILDLFWRFPLFFCKLFFSGFWVIGFVSEDSTHSICNVHKLAVILFTVLLRALSLPCASTMKVVCRRETPTTCSYANRSHDATAIWRQKWEIDILRGTATPLVGKIQMQSGGNRRGSRLY